MGKVQYKKPGASKFKEFSGTKTEVKEPSTPKTEVKEPSTPKTPKPSSKNKK